MKKLVVISAGVVVLALGAAVTIPQVIDWNKYKPQIQKGIEDATGYQVQFGGPIDLAILPFPHVVIENMTVRVRQGTTAGEIADLLTLKKAEISVALAPLFSGEISVNSVNLVEPVITLDVARDGTQLWMTDKLKNDGADKVDDTGAGDSASPEKKFALKKLQIENGTIRYSDARTGKVMEAEKINTLVSADSLSGPFKVKGDVFWNNQTVEADIQSGRIDKVAKTVALQASLKMPGSNGALVQYNGVIGTAGGIDLQGETKIESQNLSATLTALTGSASTLPPLPLNVQGLLTAKDEVADLKNLKVNFGEFQGNGSVAVQNLSAKDAPMLVAVNLDSATPLKVENFMPVKSVKTVKGTADKSAPKAAAAKPLIPATLALPKAIDGTVNINLKGLSYKGADFGTVKVTAQKKGGVITTTENIDQMPGGGKLSASANLNYASGSQTVKGGVIYSDPTLSFNVNGNATSPAKFLSAFLPPETIKSMQPLFKDPVTLAAKGTVRPTVATVESGSVALGTTALTLGTSSYTLDQTGKNNAVVSLAGRDINLDHFMGVKEVAPSAQDKVQTATPVTTKKPIGDVVQETLKKLDLPVDLTVKADLQNVTLRGVTYRAVNIDGGLNGDRLDIRKAALQDPQGDVMQATGSVKQLSKLSGVDLVLSGKTSDTIAFLSSMNVDTAKLPKDFGPLSLAVDVTGEKPESLAFKARASALDGEGEANGLLVNAMAAKPAVDKLSLRIKHSNFEQLMKKFNPGYKAGVGIRKDMDVYANINQDANGYTLSGLKAVIGGMNLTGDVSANTTGAKPDIKATLNADTIPLDILSGKDKTAKTTGGNVQTPNKAVTNDVRWSRNAINTDWMRAFNLDLKVNAKAVEYGNWLLSNTVLGVTLKDGALTIAQMDAGVYGGTMSLTADVKSSAQDRAPLAFNVKTSFKDVALEPLAASFSGAKVIQARGDVSLDLEAGSTGMSPSALVSALKGAGQLNGTNVVMKGFDLAGMSRSLVSTTKVIDNISGLASASMKGGETAFSKISGPFTISEGVISFDNFIMEGDAANILNKGTISLPRWVIDMNTTVDLAVPEDAPNLDIRFQGPLDNPGNTFAGQAMQSYIQTRVNQKLQKVLSDKVGGSPELNNLLNNVLGGGATQNPVVKTPAQTPPATTVPNATPPAESTATPQAAEPAPAEAAPVAEPTPEQRVIKGLESGNNEEALKGLMEGIIGR